MNRRNRANLIDIREERIYNVSDVNLRDVQENDNELILTGYASTFEPYEMYGGPAAGGWIEQLDRKAFDKTLRENPDLHLLINHGGMPLARTKSETLKLSVDDHGLKVEATLDRTDPDVKRLEPKMRRGDMDEMSFAFRVKAQKWTPAEGYEDLDDDQTHRSINEVSLHKGDVSVVNFGANPTTSAGVRSISQILKEVAELDADALSEFRDSDDTRKAAEVLNDALKPLSDNSVTSGISTLGLTTSTSLTTPSLSLPTSGVMGSTAVGTMGGLLTIPALDSTARELIEALEARIAKLEAEAKQHIVDEANRSAAMVGQIMGAATEIVDDSKLEERIAALETIESTDEVTSDEEELSEDGMSLREALFLNGVLPEEPLSLEEAMALL